MKSDIRSVQIYKLLLLLGHIPFTVEHRCLHVFEKHEDDVELKAFANSCL